MHIIVGIVIFIVFLGVAPRFFKGLLALDVIGLLVYFIGLKIFAAPFGKGSGSLDDSHVIVMLTMYVGAPAIIVLGIVTGLYANRTKR